MTLKVKRAGAIFLTELMKKEKVGKNGPKILAKKLNIFSGVFS
jgi:hypothetical protein